MDTRIKNSIDFVHANPDRWIDLKTLADMACLSPAHYHKLFKISLKTTPARYVQAFKMKAGYKLITKSNLTVLEVSRQIGYNDYETFSRVFKRHFKVSPDDLRVILIQANATLDVEGKNPTVLSLVSSASSEEDLISELRQDLAEKNISECELAEIQTFTVKASNQDSKKGRKKYLVSLDGDLTTQLRSKMFNLFAILIFVASMLLSSNTHGQSSSSSTLDSFLKEKGYSRIQLRKEVTGHLIITLTINDISGNFILDTGAGATLIEEKRIEKFNLKLVDSDITAAGAGGAGVKLRKSDNNLLMIENFKKDKYSMMVMNLEHVNAGLRQLGLPEVDGVLGADILANGKGVIDYSNLVLYLIP